MARRRGLRSISVPITMGAIAVPLSAALLVGWTVLFGQKIAEQQEIFVEVWLLVLGAISFTVIIGVLVLLSYFLAREILEVRRQDSFIDSVTHELKSPLAALKLCLETLARDGIPAGKREQLREMMLDDVDRLTAFIDRVLTATRISQERAPQPVSEFSLRGLVERCLGVVGKRSREPLDAVAIEIDPELALATDDPEWTVRAQATRALGERGKNANVLEPTPSISHGIWMFTCSGEIE